MQKNQSKSKGYFVTDPKLKEAENLVVGLGIAGINLCHQLEKAGKSFLVIDRCPENSASLIGGGIYNPISLKRKIKSWRADELFPVLVETYQELETQLNTSFLHHDFPILKPISSEHEITEWQQAINSERLFPYVDEVLSEPPKGPFHNNVTASVTIKKSGFLPMGKVVLAYRNYLSEKGLLIEETFDYEQLEIQSSKISYKDISADRILFSEGRFISENPHFNWVPFKPTKGQMLTVRVDATLTPDRIYNQQFLLFPTEEKNILRLGATYDWDNLDEIPTKEATEELLQKVRKALDIKLEVLKEEAAVRPTVVDRRPTIGSHPDIENLFLFNGMGTKGVMLAPFFAKQLVEHIYNGKPIDTEVDLRRFLRRHYHRN